MKPLLKFRYVYTVVRELPEKMTVTQAKEDFAIVEDETGEFLYGGAGSKETITALLEMQLPMSKIWRVLAATK